MTINNKNIDNVFYIFVTVHLIFWTLIPSLTNHNLSRWYQEISEREAVVRGYAFMDKEAKIPKV